MTTKENYLLDSNVLIGYFFSPDSLHLKATKLMDEINLVPKNSNPLLMSEVATVLLQKTKDRILVTQILKNFSSYQGSLIKINTLTQELLIQTMKIFSSQSKHKLSFPDCSLIAQAKLQKIKIIATFDKDLRKEFRGQFEFLPKRM